MICTYFIDTHFVYALFYCKYCYVVSGKRTVNEDGLNRNEFDGELNATKYEESYYSGAAASSIWYMIELFDIKRIYMQSTLPNGGDEETGKKL